MKYARASCITAIALFTQLAIPLGLAAQDNQVRDKLQVKIAKVKVRGSNFAIAALASLPEVWARSKEKVLYSFTGGKDGVGPAELLMDGSGALYGTTFGGGIGCFDQGCGVVFKLTPTSSGKWKENVLHRFTGGPDVGSPFAGLLMDGSGNLYGTTSGGGNLSCNNGYGCGVVFKLTPTSSGEWKESVLHRFTGGKDGGAPQSALLFDSVGNLYGTTAGNRGGPGSQGDLLAGTVFELTAGSDGKWRYSVLHRFTGKDLGGSTGGLVFDAAGSLYGTSIFYSCVFYRPCGVVFKLTLTSSGSWKYSVLHRFGSRGKDGSGPYAGLVFDAHGNLYGTTAYGGHAGLGTVFELTHIPCIYSTWCVSTGKWKERVLHSFNGKGGRSPFTGLVVDAAGNLYGTTSGGYFGDDGVVFELTPTSSGKWKESVLHRFTGGPDDGAGPSALLMDGSGKLYGSTAGGGASEDGTVFEIGP